MDGGNSPDDAGSSASVEDELSSINPTHRIVVRQNFSEATIYGGKRRNTPALDVRTREMAESVHS